MEHLVSELPCFMLRLDPAPKLMRCLPKEPAKLVLGKLSSDLFACACSLKELMGAMANGDESRL